MKIEKNLNKIMYSIVTFYLIVMFGVFPLYYQDKYFNMGAAKYEFAKGISVIYLGILLFCQVLKSGITIREQLQKKEKIIHLKNISCTDWFVIAYAVCVSISFFVTEYRREALWGYPEWYMGVFSQLLFILIYFFVSRYAKWDDFLLIPVLGSSAIVYSLAILQRFQIDLLGMYEGIAGRNLPAFLSTIGNMNWYSSYVCIILPIGMFAFWYAKKKSTRLWLAGYLMLGFATLVTQNSDSAYVALVAMLWVLFYFSLTDKGHRKRFLEIIIIGGLSFKLIGCLQLAYPNALVTIDPLSLFMSQGNATWVVVLLAGVVYVALHKKDWFEFTEHSKFPRIFLGISAGGVGILLLLIYLTTNGRLPAFLSPLRRVGYLRFNDAWGTGRGFIWKFCIQIYQGFPWRYRLFGCGADCFPYYIYADYREILTHEFGDKALANAHNEWLNSLLCFGISGVISYLGIFISQIRASVKIRKQQPMAIAVIMCIAAYIGHNFFCYQQIVCTPLIFMIIGMGEAFRRNGDKTIEKSKDK